MRELPVVATYMEPSDDKGSSMLEWTEEAIVLGARLHGETSVIAELFTRERGRWNGMVHGGRGRRTRPLVQPGNLVLATWTARLDEHLGRFTLEPLRLRAAHLMQSQLGIYGAQTVAGHLRLLPERDAHARLYDMADALLDNLDDPRMAGELMVRFERQLLQELGFGLDLSACAATGETENLRFVSPRSGRAVSRAGGEGYEDKLLPLPPFMLHDAVGEAGPDDLRDGFALTGRFLERAVWQTRETPPPVERDAFRRAVEKRI